MALIARVLFRPLWWLDDFGHSHMSRRLHRLVLGRVCDWCDAQLWNTTTAGPPAKESPCP